LNEASSHSGESRPTFALLQGKTLSQHSILSSEKALVAEYKRTSKFYDVVIEKIIAINRGGEIHFQ